MKTTHSTSADWSLLVVRLILGGVIAAHGAQKLFGWFGGFGFQGSMEFFTNEIGLPYVVSFLIILEESFGMLALALGLFTRACAAGLIAIMAGAILTTSAQHGFFMNWFGNQAGEGLEYHLLVIAMAIPLVLQGAGAYSVDNLTTWLPRSVHLVTGNVRKGSK